MLYRDRYHKNHASNLYLSSVHKKLDINIQNYYSIALPRWTLRFISKLLLTALGYNTREHKGKVKVRQVNDTSALISGTNDSGALKLHIKRRDNTAMTLVHYQYVLQHLSVGYEIYVSEILKKIS